jgi:hypothetical protein
MSTSQLAKEVFSIVERKVLSDSPSMEFEMAYQMKVAGERIRFALKSMDRIAPGATVQEISLQLLDALDRMERVDRRFQRQSSHNQSNGDLHKATA